jgi:hypothetical protein
MATDGYDGMGPAGGPAPSSRRRAQHDSWRDLEAAWGRAMFRGFDEMRQERLTREKAQALRSPVKNVREAGDS